MYTGISVNNKCFVFPSHALEDLVSKIKLAEVLLRVYSEEIQILYTKIEGLRVNFKVTKEILELQQNIDTLFNKKTVVEVEIKQHKEKILEIALDKGSYPWYYASQGW